MSTLSFDLTGPGRPGSLGKTTPFSKVKISVIEKEAGANTAVDRETGRSNRPSLYYHCVF
jgi:hypothetical protein